MQKSTIVSMSRSLAVSLLAVFLTGCPASNSSSNSPASQTPAPAANSKKVIIRGSNTIGEDLAPKLIAGFKKIMPDVEFDVDTKATGYGFASLRAKLCDIAAASRYPNKEEQAESAAMNVVLSGKALGSYAVKVVVNAKNSVTNLTKAQVEGIFTGSITNWHDLGGADSVIHLVARNPVSGTYIGFKNVAMNDKDYSVASISFGDTYAAVADKVGADDAAIGYTGFQTEPDSVRAVAIEGVQPDVNSVNSGKYPYVRGLYFYTLIGDEKPTAKLFVDFAVGQTGQGIVADAGFVPHP